MNTLEALNAATFLRMNADLNTPHWKIGAATFLADYLIYLIPLVLIGMWCWGKQMQRNLALKACLVALVALGVNQIIILLWPIRGRSWWGWVIRSWHKFPTLPFPATTPPFSPRQG